MAEINVIVEVSVPRTAPADAVVMFLGAEMSVAGLRIDPTYQPVEIRPLHATVASQLDVANEKAVVIRGAIEEKQMEALRRNPRVLSVSRDGRIAPFSAFVAEAAFDLQLTPETGPCPQVACDCGSGPDQAK